MMRNCGVLAVLVGGLLGSPWLAATASAKTPTAPDPSAVEARLHYNNGTKAFDLIHYEDAIKEFEMAYQLRPDPAFLYNIAQANRLAGHLDKALRMYRNFLLHLPADAPQREGVERRIAEVEQALKTQPMMPPQGDPSTGTTNTETPPVTTTTRPATTTSSNPDRTTTSAIAQPPTSESSSDSAGSGHTLKIAGLATGIGGVVLVGVGVGLGVASLSARDSYAHPQPGDVYDSGLQQRANLFPVLGIALAAVGAVAVGAGAFLYFRGRNAERHTGAQAMFVPVLSPSQAGGALFVSF